MLTGKEKRLLQALEPLAKENGVEIVTVEVVGSRRAPTIRVYVDTPDGVGFDELASAQRWIGQKMDEVDPFPGAYTLEVSSPGIDRPLRTPEHFRRFAGETVQVTCKRPVQGRGKFTGVLLGLADEAGAPVADTAAPDEAGFAGVVALEVDGKRADIDWDNVKRANVKGVVDFDERNEAE